VSFADWAAESRQRFREESLVDAAVRSAREFARGAANRTAAALLSVLGPKTFATTLAGQHATWVVDDSQALDRARTLCREEPVAEWLFEDLDANSLLWDVGAYHGHYAVLASLQGASVRAFEPNSVNRWRLNEHVRLNPMASVRVSPIALSNRDGETGIHMDGSESTVGNGNASVGVSRGDSLDGQPTHVKVDVEGHEVAVLEGMAETLTGVERIVVEVHDGTSSTKVTSQLRAAGLEVEAIDSPRSQTHIGGVRR